MAFNLSTLKKVTQNLSLITLLSMVGSTSLHAQENSVDVTVPYTSDECLAVFGDYDADEFEGIELTAEQSSAIDQAADQWETQAENLMSPEQLSALETATEEFETAYLPILTPEQRSQYQAGDLDFTATLSPEQEAAIEALQSQYLEAMPSWDLSAEQVERMQQQAEDYEAAVLDALTPQQREQYVQNQILLYYPELAELDISREQWQQLAQLIEQSEQELWAQMAQGPDEAILEDSDIEQQEAQYREQLLSLLNDEQQQQVAAAWETQDSLESQCWGDSEVIEEPVE
ncbi:MAG: hypothetical protein AAFW75_19770 [Cyanobacteria bacterium J06636_16]